MRVFIALELPPSFHRDMDEALQKQRFSHPEIHWMSDENLHITMTFLGEISPLGVTLASAAASETAAAVRPIRIEAGKLRYFPPRGTPTVLALGIGMGSRELTVLEERLVKVLSRAYTSAGLAPQGWEKKRASFMPHITIARAARRGFPFNPEELDISIKATGTATTLTVYSSELTPLGAVYRPLSRHRLGRRSAQ